MADVSHTEGGLLWAPLGIAELMRTGKWRTREFLALLSGWLALTALCLLYGLWPHPLGLNAVDLGFGTFSLFPPLIIAFVVLFWFGLEWAAVLVTAASVGVGLRFGLRVEWLIPFSVADAAGLTVVALVYRLLRLPYLMTRPSAALGYIASHGLCVGLLATGAIFLFPAQDAGAQFMMRGWRSWWTGGMVAAGIAAVVLHVFSPAVERWKALHLSGRRCRLSYRALLITVLTGGVLIGTLVLGVSDLLWTRLDLTLRSGSVERIEGNLSSLRAIWSLLSRVGILLMLGLSAGGVALAWRWSRALEEESRRRASEQEEAEQRFRATFEEAPIGIGHLLPDGRFILANAKMGEILGYSPEEMRELNYYSTIDPAERDLARQRATQLFSGQVPHFEFERSYLGKGGVRVWARAHSSVASTPAGMAGYCLLILEDIRQRKELEDQLRQTNKMEAIGRLAGGVAHDFNNLLTAILGFTEMAQYQCSNGADPSSSLAQVKRGAERAAELTRQLLVFSSRQVLDTQLIDLNAKVRECCSLLPPLMGTGVGVRLECAGGLPPVLADPAHVSQVVMNLATNARDAMPRGGTLWIRTRLENRRVVLEVEDDGEGIPEELLPKIFEPFYTTKGRGRGTGLGLATVYGIVQQMGGEVTVRSAPGLGTCFQVRMDAQEGIIVRQAETPDRPQRPLAVLLAEDEPAVREFTAKSLAVAGHSVTAADCGEAALALFKADTFDLLVTDMLMPGIGGRELADRLRERQPGLPVVFVSGFSDAGQAAQLPGPFVHKPFSTARLLAAMSEATAGRLTASSLPHSAE